MDLPQSAPKVNQGSGPELQQSPAIPDIQIHYEHHQPHPVRQNTMRLEGTADDVPINVTYPTAEEDYKCPDKLLRKYQRKHYKGHDRFLPMNLLHRILTRERVLRALKSDECSGIDDRRIDAYCDAIACVDSTSFQKKYAKIFAILIMQGKGGEFGLLFDHGISDDCLPLVEILTEEGEEGLGLAFERRIHPFFIQGEWKHWHMDNFLSYQRQLLPHFFSSDKDEDGQKIASGTILPWLRSYGQRDEGGFGKVRKYQVDPDSHGFHEILESITLNQDCVAVKRIKRTSKEKKWEDEVAMLRRFSGKDHPHLITLLCSYTIDETNHLLFPWADLDLDKYWTFKKSPLKGPGDIDVVGMRWVSKQIQGLIGALKFIHGPKKQLLDPEDMYGKHGDLKPENILWFQSPSDPLGIFVITDFGLAEVHKDQSKSNIPNKEVPTTPGYRSPECDIEGGEISRAFDIWTLGCMLLELVCWLLGGHEMREQFEEDRGSIYVTGVISNIFFDIQRSVETGKYVVMVKDKVVKWMNDLLRHGSCTQYIRDLVCLIHRKMIVVLSPSTLRGRADDILRDFDGIHTTAMNERQLDYIQKHIHEKSSIEARDAVEVELNSTAKKLIEGGTRLKNFTKRSVKISEAEFKKAQGN